MGLPQTSLGHGIVTKLSSAYKNVMSHNALTTKFPFGIQLDQISLP